MTSRGEIEVALALPFQRLFTFAPKYSVSKSFVLRAGEEGDIDASTVDQA